MVKRVVWRLQLLWKISVNFKETISLIFFTVTLVLLAVSLVVHALFYADFNTRDNFPVVWRCLQYAVVVGFIPKAVSSLLMRLGITSRPPPYIWGSAKYEERSSWQIYGEIVVGAAIVLLCLYAIFNPIYWWVERLHQGLPYTIDGQYFAYFRRSRKVRSLTAEEYRVFSLYFARSASSHWGACHSLALVLLYGGWRRAG